MSEIKEINKRNGRSFFDEGVMAKFDGVRYTPYYDGKTGNNYLFSQWGHYHKVWYTFNPKTGELNYTSESKIPKNILED